MEGFVDERFKINIYLDTNILVEYIESSNTLLVESLKYLAKCPFVILRSSHYVEYEMVEVRKKRLFFQKVRGHLPVKGEPMGNIKQTWELDGKKYETYREDIAKVIISDFNFIEEELGIRFDDHVLHKKLINPTRDMCLGTKISREDCMVMISCMFPNIDELLEFGVLFSNDKQYLSAIEENEDKVTEVLKQYEIISPLLLNAKKLNNGVEVLNIEANNSKSIDELILFWKQLIMKLLIKKLQHLYLGQTIKIGKSDICSKLIFIDIEDPNKELTGSDGLYFVLNDLSRTIEISKDFDFWDNYSAVTLPHVNKEDTKYSFKPSNLQKDILSKLQEKGNLVFYSM